LPCVTVLTAPEMAAAYCAPVGSLLPAGFPFQRAGASRWATHTGHTGSSRDRGQPGGGCHVVDHIRHPARVVAAGHGVVVHARWLHSRVAGRGDRDRPDPADSGQAGRMKPAAIVGALLIIVGIAGLAFGGFSWTHKEKVLDVGPIEAHADKKESVP